MTMKRFLTIAIFALCSLGIVPVRAQLVEPVKWSGEELGDSVRLTATIDEGWHMTIISLAEREWNDEYAGTFSVTLAKTELTPVRFNACDDRMCTAPETWEFDTDRLRLKEQRLLMRDSRFG